MKVLIVVYEGNEWKRDTLESRMVDTRWLCASRDGQVHLVRYLRGEVEETNA